MTCARPVTGRVVSSAFIWRDGEEKEQRQWTGPKQKRWDARVARSEARSDGSRERTRCKAWKNEEKSRRQEGAANGVIMDMGAFTQDDARSQRAVNGQPIHLKHERMEADCHCHIPTVWS